MERYRGFMSSANRIVDTELNGEPDAGTCGSIGVTTGGKAPDAAAISDMIDGALDAWGGSREHASVIEGDAKKSGSATVQPAAAN